MKNCIKETRITNEMIEKYTLLTYLICSTYYKFGFTRDDFIIFVIERAAPELMENPNMLVRIISNRSN